MIIVVLIISLIYIILLTLILIAYYRDTSDMELRILELEKRLNELQKDFEDEDETFTNYCEMVNGLAFNQEYAFKKLNLVENEEVNDMPCGRPKGRKSTSKGGGRRK